MTAAEREMCLPTDGPVMAYYGQRVLSRKSVRDEPLHAVSQWSILSGAMDAECGVIAAVEAGPWMGPWPVGETKDGPGPISRCARCAKLVAGQAVMPADGVPKRNRHKPVEQLAPAVVEPVQLQMFDAA